ncbi:uncharacterized protein LOC144704218 [Wolffia australiana]
MTAAGNKFWSKKTLIGLALGQFVSLLITSTSFSSSELSREGINVPTCQSFLNYALLAFVFGCVMIFKRKKGLRAKWYYYLILAIIDVEANYFVVKAYQYTNITSIMMLDCWVIPCVIVLTFVFLKTRYRYVQYFGALLCIAGAILVVFSDVFAGGRESGSNPLKGNLFVILSSTLYAFSNVGEEYLVRDGSRVELLTMLGVFGTIISAIQISILERRELASIRWTAGAALPFAGFTAAMFLLYSTVPTILKIAGSAMFNLSLLTSDMWGVLIRTFAYHERVDWIYFLAFAAVLAGLIAYSWRMDSDQRVQTARIDVETPTPQEGGDMKPWSLLLLIRPLFSLTESLE